MKRVVLVSVLIGLGLVLLFSACTLAISQQRDELVRSAEAGNAGARVLVWGANFWARYFLFCTIGLVALFVSARRFLVSTGRW